jgi:hypothetical protein
MPSCARHMPCSRITGTIAPVAAIVNSVDLHLWTINEFVLP